VKRKVTRKLGEEVKRELIRRLGEKAEVLHPFTFTSFSTIFTFLPIFF
jgi:hypothetical protein